VRVPRIRQFDPLRHGKKFLVRILGGALHVVVKGAWAALNFAPSAVSETGCYCPPLGA
jgi:hypothetical protein